MFGLTDDEEGEEEYDEEETGEIDYEYDTEEDE